MAFSRYSISVKLMIRVCTGLVTMTKQRLNKFYFQIADLSYSAHINDGLGICPANPRSSTTYLKLKDGEFLSVFSFPTLFSIIVNIMRLS